jgi:hypothetical protein
MSGQGNRNIKGGMITQTGIGYQNRVAAWMCVRILGERDIAPLWRLKADVTFEYIRCETGQPVDDVLVGTSEDGHLFINVKHSVTNSKRRDSPLGSAISQFVRQFVSYSGQSVGQRPWERQLNADIDRLVLVTTSRSSLSITNHLPRLLSSLRSSPAQTDINAVATNRKERETLAIIREHIRRSWHDSIGADICESDEWRLLKLIWVEIIDVDEDGEGEREAKDRLRAVVLANKEQADSAWNALITACSGYASRQGGADRSMLQDHLLKAGISINAPSSYRKDISKLVQRSEQTLNSLQELSRILVGEREVKIQRPSSQSLRAVAEQDSVVVVGEPGAGKSGALHDLVSDLRLQNRDTLFLAVDRLEAQSLGALRSELNLEHDLIDVLKNWKAEGPAFLVIDALDAARSESSAQTFYDLISLTLQLAERWHVVASIRRFDLRHHTRLHSLFEGHPLTEYSIPEFAKVRHFKVPLLSDDEWLQVQPQSPELAKLFDEASENLRSLLLVPFNLRLAGELLGNGVEVDTLTPIETQIELLDRYWHERIIRKDHEGDAREAVLHSVVEGMVNARGLRVSRRLVANDPSVSKVLGQLLSSHILAEWESEAGTVIDRAILTFPHHVLFDYAAERLLFRGTPEALVQRLESDPNLVLAVRPSIVMHFQHLWHADVVRFWDSYFRLISSEQIPEIGKLVGASVAVESMQTVESYTPLVRALSSTDVQQKELAEKVFRHITGAILVLAAPNSIGRLISHTAPPWLELLDQCTASMRVSLAYSIRPVLWTLCGNSELFTETQRAHAGNIARRLLAFGLSQEPRDPAMVVAGLETVVRTFESDSVASAFLLRQCLEPQHVLAYGHEELFRLAQEVDRLLPHFPDLVEEMFNAAFTYYDESDEKTWVLASRILPLTSTRRQDFDMARFSFAQKYQSFLDVAPRNATRALINAVNTYVAERFERRYSRLGIHIDDGGNTQASDEERFEFDSRDAFIRTDYSEIWDNGATYGHDEPLKMLESFQAYLERISANPERKNERSELLKLIVEENRNAVFWRRLLNVGIKHPDTIGREIRSLAWAMPILTSYDTTRMAGEFIKTIFSTLSDEERRRVEQTILAIPNLFEGKQREAAEHQRDRLLGCLIKNSLVTPEARALLERLEAEKNIPSNDRLFRSEVVTGRYTEEDYLKDQGVPLGEEPNNRVLTLSQPVKAFAAKYQNSVPTVAEASAVIPHLQTLHTKLITAEVDGVHERQRDAGWGHLADACASVVKLDEWLCESDDSNFIKAVLLEASDYPDPAPHEENYDHFDEHPSWGAPAARVDAAVGLSLLASKQSCVDDDLLAAIKRLALHDSVPAVRFQVVIRLNTLYHTAPDLMWELLETVSRDEQRRGILQFLLNGPLRILAPYHPDRITELTTNIFERTSVGAGAKEVRKRSAAIFLGLYLWQGQAECERIIKRITEDPVQFSDEIHEIVFDLRSWLNLGLEDRPTPEHEAVRLGSIHLLDRILKTIRDRLTFLETKNKNLPFNSWPTDEQEVIRDLTQLAESVCMQVYFASGAYGKDNHPEGQENIPLGAEARSRFLKDMNAVLQLLSEFSNASMAHHLLQTLEFLIQYDPKNVFLIVGKVVNSAKPGGYQYESMAVDLIVKLVERFIAEYRYVLLENEECRRILIEILDVFVEAGWPSARRLTYRMEEIFR